MNPSENANRPPEAAVHTKSELLSPPAQLESAVERAPGGESRHSGPSGDPVASVPVNNQLPPIVPGTDQPVATTVTDDTPLAASDDEVMEQEWVQKAKRIVSQTKGDPFTQEKEVGKLQAEYIKKRYGKEIKLTSD